jgi:hypothetical protein
MARRIRTTPIGLAFTAWEIWRRIPKQQRRAILRQARIYGPKFASQMMKLQQQRRRGPS